MRIACDAADRTGMPVDLMTSTGAALAGGAPYCAEVLERGLSGNSKLVGARIIDCGDRADLVFAALDAGWQSIVFDGERELTDVLQAIADAAGSKLLLSCPDALDLEGENDPLQAAIDWIENDRRS